MDKIKPAKNEGSSIHIILADDDPVLLDTTKELLEMLGYYVTTAIGGHEAIALMKRSLFDVVITDYDMPEMNGLELASIVKKNLVKTPLILFSGRLDLIDERQIAEAGVTEVVSKPCTIKKLDCIIKKAIAKINENTATP